MSSPDPVGFTGAKKVGAGVDPAPFVVVKRFTVPAASLSPAREIRRNMVDFWFCGSRRAERPAPRSLQTSPALYRILCGSRHKTDLFRSCHKSTNSIYLVSILAFHSPFYSIVCGFIAVWTYLECRRPTTVLKKHDRSEACA